MIIPQLHFRLTLTLFVICFGSCGQVTPNLTGTYSSGQVFRKDADSAFIEITQDSVLIITSYIKYSDTYSSINIAMAKLKLRNDTIYAYNDYPNDSVYCDRVWQYSNDHKMGKVGGPDIGCIIWNGLFITDFDSKHIKLSDGDKTEILRKIK